MTKFLLALHVLAAILAIGPVAVAASMFPAAVRGAGPRTATAHVLHRICRVYAQVGIAVPVFGFATASALHVLGSGWLIASVVLTMVAAVVLGLLVLPRQHALLAELSGLPEQPQLLEPAAEPAGLVPEPATLAEAPSRHAAEPPIASGASTAVSRADTARLAMLTGLFNLLWATVTVLMIVRPGSTTGA